jgi:hypothetical protein
MSRVHSPPATRHRSTGAAEPVRRRPTLCASASSTSPARQARKMLLTVGEWENAVTRKRSESRRQTVAGFLTPFSVTWADGSTSPARSSSHRVESHAGGWWWFFRLGTAIVSIGFPNAVLEALPQERNARFALLTDAIVAWAHTHPPEQVKSAPTLVARLERGRLILSEAHTTEAHTAEATKKDSSPPRLRAPAHPRTR